MATNHKEVIICDAKKLLKVKHDLIKLEKMLEGKPYLAKRHLRRIFNYIVEELLEAVEQ